jgi:hypothetical protein
VFSPCRLVLVLGNKPGYNYVETLAKYPKPDLPSRKVCEARYLPQEPRVAAPPQSWTVGSHNDKSSVENFSLTSLKLIIPKRG